MANLLSRTERYAYIRVALDVRTFARLTEWFGDENHALRELRLAWHNGVRILMLEVPPETLDGSASASGPGPTAPEGRRE